ncbi:MAG: dTMP kinase [Anaerolineales bacterium]
MSLFISFEGPDGCGKSTQAKLLTEWLKVQGYPVLLTREPGGTAIGDQVRKVLMSLENRRMNPRTEFLLFSASRTQLVHEVIRPHLEAGGVIVSDRFYDSSLAYQGYGHGLDEEALRAITDFVTGGLKPDLTFLLDLAARVGLTRRRDGGNWNRLDDYDLEFHKRARQGYLSLASAEPDRWRVVEADRPIDDIQAEIQNLLLPYLEATDLNPETA